MAPPLPMTDILYRPSHAFPLQSALCFEIMVAMVMSCSEKEFHSLSPCLLLLQSSCPLFCIFPFALLEGGVSMFCVELSIQPSHILSTMSSHVSLPSSPSIKRFSKRVAFGYECECKYIEDSLALC